MIDKKYFYDNFPFRPLKPGQVEAINQILDAFDTDIKITSLRWLAYMLGTAKHETNDTYLPVAEAYYLKPESKRINALTKMYSGRRTIIKNGVAYYYGRGLVQLTHDYNYMTMSKKLGVNFTDNPEKAMEMYYAIQIMFIGMREGLFTGRKLPDYFNDKKTDWVHARKIINGLDRANLIADYARKFYGCLKLTNEEYAHKAINETIPDPNLVRAESA